MVFLRRTFFVQFYHYTQETSKYEFTVGWAKDIGTIFEKTYALGMYLNRKKT